MLSGYTILKQSIDARGKQAWVNLTIQALSMNPFSNGNYFPFTLKMSANANKKVIIVGAGPAGLFAALNLLNQALNQSFLKEVKMLGPGGGILPYLNKEGEVNPESNYCFGEGGAGTYSDGKLYTRSTKRGDVNRILNLFVHFGAEEKIFMKLIRILAPINFRRSLPPCGKQIIDCGGEVFV